MTIQRINYGAAPDDGTGDKLRDAFRKTDDNFTDLDTRKANGEDVVDALAFKADVTYVDTELAKKADIASPALTGTPTAPTASAATNTTQLATTAFVQAVKAADTGSAATALTLKTARAINGTSFDGSANITTANWGTARNITIGGVTKSVNGSANVVWTADESGAVKSFTSVPITNQGLIIVVTLPHMRLMQWNGTKYVRSPLGKMPGEYFYAHDPLGKITHGIQVRTDVTYNRADHPDLAEHLGVAEATFVLPGDGRARVLRGADLGCGTDADLVDGYMQEDALQQHTHSLPVNLGYIGAGYDYANHAYNNYGTTETSSVLYGREATETRVKSLVARLYITR